MDVDMDKNAVDLVERPADGYTPEDPVLTATQKAIERRLLWKADMLIVGMTALVFLVNQWVRPLSTQIIALFLPGKARG